MNVHKHHHCITGIVSFFFIILSSYAQDFKVHHLKCENKTSPSGIERKNPVLSWQMVSEKRGKSQRAYRILVADDLLLLHKDSGNLWDSRKIFSNVSIQIPYEGKALEAAHTYYWKVMVWDETGKTARWSQPASWQMGLLSPADWAHAKWIAYEEMHDSLVTVPAEHGKGSGKGTPVRNTLPLLRKSFSISKRLRSAHVFISGLGHFEMRMNGKKTGDHFLDPGWTQYAKEAQYVCFDVTRQINPGNNAIGIMLGNGFYFIPGERYRKMTGAYGFPKLMFLMLLTYADGSTENIVSDGSWKTTAGPITFSSIYGGEDYNATLEKKGWDMPSYDESLWEKVVIVSGPAILHAQTSPSLKVHEQFTPVAVKKLKDRSFVYDLGQNASGIPLIRVKGKRGDTVRIIPAELLKEDGSASQRATGSPVYFQYILKGEGVETWQPRFSYYGFRFLQVDGAVPAGTPQLRDAPVLLQVKGLHTRSAVKSAGTFHCSFDLFNQTKKLIDWAIKSNMASVLTDCPHREKLGWLEQTHLMGNSIRFNYDMSSFFQKTIRDMSMAQDEKGLVPEYVPEYVKMPFMDGIFMDSPEWGSASVILPWYMYLWYGDRRILEENYGLMKGYVSHLSKKSNNGIVAYGLSDWYDLGPNKPGLAQLTPMGITATAIYYYDLTIITKVAGMLGKTEDVRYYEEEAIRVKDAFNKTFFNVETRQYGTGSQTANAMAVYMNLVPEEYREAVIENIISDIRKRNNGLTAGDVGYRYLLKVLDDAGRSDMIFDMNSRTDIPGYGYQLAKGATALTESWQALPSVSNNHLMLGHLMEWFYSGLSGIYQSDSSVAFTQVVIRPQMVKGVHHAKASYESPYGLIRSEWKKNKEGFTLEVTIPANSEAWVRLPATSETVVKESGKSLTGRKDIRQIRSDKNALMIRIGSGSYRFTASGYNSMAEKKYKE